MTPLKPTTYMGEVDLTLRLAISVSASSRDEAKRQAEGWAQALLADISRRVCITDHDICNAHARQVHP